MPTYYIDNCEFKEEKPWKNKTLHIYEITVKNTEGTYTAQLAQSPTTPPPSGNIEGFVEETDFGPKFRKNKPQGQQSTERSTEYVSGRTPEERNSIVRQHSQTVAVYYAAILQKAHPDIEPNYPWLKQIIDWFDEDARPAS